MPLEKIPVIYDPWNPNNEGVTHIAIQIESSQPYVWRVYYAGETIPRLPEDLLIVTRQQANRLFEFRKGDLKEF